jgi:hypothetical protein
MELTRIPFTMVLVLTMNPPRPARVWVQPVNARATSITSACV